MNKKFRYINAIFALLILLYSLSSFQLSFAGRIVFWSSIVAALIMDLSMLYVDELNVEFTETITVFIYLLLGVHVAVAFEFLYTLLGFVINYKFGKREYNASRFILNISMFTVITYLAGISVNILRTSFIHLPYITGLLISALAFDAIFLMLNIISIVIDRSLEDKKIFSIRNIDFEILGVNLIISTMLSVVLYIIYGAVGLFGVLLVFGVLIIVHYAFYLYNKIEFKNDLVKKLLDTTEDLIKYGDLKEKSDHLLLNLKSIIPYEVASLYFFDSQNDEVVFPISYYAPEDLDIGELNLNLKNGITFSVIKNGEMYISRNIKKEEKVKITGKLLKYTDAAIFMPIMINGTVRGLIFAAGKTSMVGFLSQDVNDILNILSRQMSLALQNYDYVLNIKKQANTDVLTGLNNRRVFNREIENLVKLKNRFSVVIYDIDDFKKVNDVYGHLVGDEVLKNVADIIKRSIRKTDIACRYGGEEIVIIFKDLSKEDAYVISERIRKRIENTHVFAGEKVIKVTVSGGVSSYPDDGITADEILEKADLILYSECKSKGKNRVCIYPKMV